MMINYKKQVRVVYNMLRRKVHGFTPVSSPPPTSRWQRAWAWWLTERFDDALTRTFDPWFEGRAPPSWARNQLLTYMVRTHDDHELLAHILRCAPRATRDRTLQKLLAQHPASRCALVFSEYTAK